MSEHEHERGTEPPADLAEIGLAEPRESRSHRGGRRSRRGRRAKGVAGCLIPLLIVAMLVGGSWIALTKGVDYVRDQFADPEDFPGPGSGSVTVEVEQGDTAADIGRMLKEKGVVASVDAFTAAANARSDEAGRIQVGFYEVQSEMRANDALSVLVDPANLLQSAVTIPEGLRVVDIVELLAKNTDFGKARYEKALDEPGKLGLPKYAGGEAEGYLFPATYMFKPNDDPTSILRTMVDRWKQAADEAGIVEAADELGYEPEELVTIASLVEAEGRGDDMPKIARVIYNRLETKGEPTYGKLEIDATVNYALGRNLGVAISQEDLDVDSEYNTRRYPGLPPGPIEAPGLAALEAAANPAEGDWFFYVTVNLKTGETKFAEDYDQFLEYKAEFQEYCQTSDAC
ncbi:endolytic transglycosylase MltG [Nocardioides donggukensis]|uniref:Endolytic murein transglycosylase n=1 Tax=Nocardioides donggukensis TaxID=2774019 RepID=A0A927K380_9ACTN|nr:endolytic transglycosylase MltG [Nocardioides donggukensis]MBD8869757.1 endolytic transglycosylase MltG [Nocardioides donggukensis]